METHAKPAAAVRIMASPLPGEPCSGFDIAKMDRGGWLSRLLKWALQYPQCQWWMGVFRWAAPICRIPGLGWFITRCDDVREVLSRDAAFGVPWGGKMMELTGDRNFVLGMP